MMRSSKTETGISRRKFLTIAGVATTAVGLAPGNVLANEKMSAAKPEAGNVLQPVKLFENAIAEVIETKVICAEPGKVKDVVRNAAGHWVESDKMEPGRYIGWPTIIRTHDNRLMVVFSGDRDEHVCPFGKTQVVTSIDNSKTWSEPRTITNTQLDDRDAGITQTTKGTLVVSWFTSLEFENPTRRNTYAKYFRIGEKIPVEVKKKLLGNWTRRSEDGGKTWSEPSRTNGTAPHGPIALKNGNLLYISTGKWEGKGEIVCELSTDDGKSWKTISYIPKHPDYQVNLTEPHVVELKSGKLLAMIRNEPVNRNCYLLQSESTDGGKTWTQMKLTPIWGYPPHLKQLANGWLLVVYGVRRAPFSERACVSKDEGKTWDYANEITLCEGVNSDLGYPSSTQLDDGSILTAYYQCTKVGEPTVLMTTHWKLK